MDNQRALAAPPTRMKIMVALGLVIAVAYVLSVLPPYLWTLRWRFARAISVVVVAKYLMSLKAVDAALRFVLLGAAILTLLGLSFVTPITRQLDHHVTSISDGVWNVHLDMSFQVETPAPFRRWWSSNFKDDDTTTCTVVISFDRQMKLSKA